MARIVRDYNMKKKMNGKTISDIQKLFFVDKATVSKWCFEFKEYLPSEQNRRPGQERLFIWEDIIVLSYISYHWEDNPDIESISIGLNNEEYMEDFFKNFANKNSPIFSDLPENPDDKDIDSTILLMGLAERSQLDIARGYMCPLNSILKKYSMTSDWNILFRAFWYSS